MQPHPLAQLHTLIERLTRATRPLGPYFILCRLHQPADLILLLLPALWVLSLNPEPIPVSATITLLLAASAIRCAVWIYHELALKPHSQQSPGTLFSYEGLKTPKAWPLFGTLTITAALLLLSLGLAVLLWAAAGLLLLIAYPKVKRRTLLTQPYLGLCSAWIVVVIHPLVPEMGLKLLLTLFTTTWLWASANTLLSTAPAGGQDEATIPPSLHSILGDNSVILVFILQLFVVIALWLIGRQVALGGSFALALLATLAQLPYQQWVLTRDPLNGARRAYHGNIAVGLTILIGLLSTHG